MPSWMSTHPDDKRIANVLATLAAFLFRRPTINVVCWKGEGAGTNPRSPSSTGTLKRFAAPGGHSTWTFIEPSSTCRLVPFKMLGALSSIHGYRS